MISKKEHLVLCQEHTVSFTNVLCQVRGLSYLQLTSQLLHLSVCLVISKFSTRQYLSACRVKMCQFGSKNGSLPQSLRDTSTEICRETSLMDNDLSTPFYVSVCLSYKNVKKLILTYPVMFLCHLRHIHLTIVSCSARITGLFIIQCIHNYDNKQ